MGHGYVLSMAVGTIGVETGPFFVRGRTVDLGGGGVCLFKKKKNLG